MAGVVHPREAARPTKSPAELELYRALRRSLPEGWVAWHSLRLRVGTKWEGEGDFVLAVPDHGLLVLEVKGGQVELRDGRWFQGGKALSRAPRDQAQTFVRHLVGEVRRRGATPPAFGVACAFTECEFSEGPDTGELRGLVIGARDLPWLGHVLPALAKAAIPEAASTDPAWIEVLHAIWGETWVPHVRLRDRVRDAEDRAVALDEQQLAILDFAGGNSRALVEGGAGTGKTILARELCVRRAREGRSAHYVCFTDALAGVVAAASVDPLVRATPLRRLALELTGEPPPTDADRWRALLLRAAAIARALPAPSLVVVDEAQDFEQSDWALLEALTQDADLWAFRDPAQGFWAERTARPELLANASRLTLLKQQRNPPAVAALAARYLPDAKPAPVPAGDSLRLVAAPEGGTWEAVGAEVARLVADGARAREIAIVSLAGQTRSELLRIDRVGDVPVVRADAPEAPQHLVGDTFLRFKGLDRPFVIVAEAALALGDRYDVRMHIALTRATAGCTIVAEPEVLAQDARLREIAAG